METILIVDDEDSIRRTFAEWLATTGVNVLAVGDAAAALALANTQPIDLAILDWNLGTGSDGLRLLEDLVDFQPDLVAILVTGYAAQATPLEALRKGVRDYLDKNSDLTRDTFLSAVRKQLAYLVPAKRQREFLAGTARFRDAVEKVLPLVRGAATLNDPVPLAAALKSLAALALAAIAAKDAAFIIAGSDGVSVFDAAGQALESSVQSFPTTVAAAALSMRRPSVMTHWNDAGVTLLPCERGRSTLLAIPLPAGDGVQVVLELFDKPAFTDADRALAARLAEVGGELLRGVLAERQTHRLLADAVEAALQASRDAGDVGTPPSDPPPAAVMESLRRGLDESLVDADLGLDLVTAVRELAVRHGPPAVEHCVTLVRSLRTLLDQVT